MSILNYGLDSINKILKAYCRSETVVKLNCTYGGKFFVSYVVPLMVENVNNAKMCTEGQKLKKVMMETIREQVQMISFVFRSVLHETD